MALDGVSVTRVTFAPGARWSVDLKPYAGTELCELPHVAVVLSGRLGVQMRDGSTQEFTANDVMLLPPGHDAWTIGDEPFVFVEFSRGNDYYVFLYEATQPDVEYRFDDSIETLVQDAAGVQVTFARVRAHC